MPKLTSAHKYNPTDVDSRPGDYFVSVVDGDRYGLLSGPYTTHQAALADVEACKQLAIEIDCRLHFAGFGTCRMESGSGYIGTLQRHKVKGAPRC